MTKKAGIRMLCLSAIFTALTVICTMINIPIPIGPVPINLATLSVLLAGGILGSKYGTLSQLCYLLMGAIGLPVFSNFSGGLAKLFGPTGGYIWGYILAAFLVGMIVERFGTKVRFMIVGMAVGSAGCYLLGTIWFIFVTGSTPAVALMTCVIPFLPGNTVKIAAACLLIPKLRKIVWKP